MLPRAATLPRLSASLVTLSPRAVTVLLSLLAVCAVAPALAQRATRRAKSQAKHADASPSSLPVMMLSDIHFEPFRDPAKLPQLREAPVDKWPAILSAPASATQEADFKALQAACPVRGVDTAWALLSTSLRQAAAQQPRPLFVTVSGDFLSHEFNCRFRTLAPKATAEEASGFAAKTVEFLSAQLHLAFPGSPLYLALGNNDSGCADYREDRNSAFLQHAAEAFAGAAQSGRNGEAILREFSDLGDYSVELPAPMKNARLVVLQDIFETQTYAGCNGKPNADAATAQLAWLRSQLDEARTRQEHVWVMAHVPPGVNMYSTLRDRPKVCSGQPPAMFLGSEGMAEVLTAYPDVISLAIFAHSHADELRYLHGATAETGIPVKLVSSISPVNGNHPTFTVGQVDPQSAELLDYTVFLTGDGPAATKEYSFRETYKLPSFSAGSLQLLTGGFLADTAGSNPGSSAYQHFFFPGDNGLHAVGMQLFWRAYACSLRENKPESYRACACPVAAQ